MLSLTNKSYIEFENQPTNADDYNRQLEAMHESLKPYKVRDVLPTKTFLYAGAGHDDIDWFKEFGIEAGDFMWNEQTMEQLVFEPLHHPLMGDHQIITKVRHYTVDLESIMETLVSALTLANFRITNPNPAANGYSFGEGFMIDQSYPSFQTTDINYVHSHSQNTLHCLFVPLNESQWLDSLGMNAFLIQDRSDPNAIVSTICIPEQQITFTVKYSKDVPTEWVLKNQGSMDEGQDVAVVFDTHQPTQIKVDDYTTGQRIIRLLDHGVWFAKEFPTEKIENVTDEGYTLVDQDTKTKYNKAQQPILLTKYQDKEVIGYREYNYASESGMGCYFGFHEQSGSFEAASIPVDHEKDYGWTLCQAGKSVVTVTRQTIPEYMQPLNQDMLDQLNYAFKIEEKTNRYMVNDEDFDLFL